MAFVIKCRQTDEIIAHGSVLTLEGCWYFAPEAVNMDLLTVSERTYTCPYKGVCNWIDINASSTQAKSVVFVYPNPKPGYEQIAGRIAFYARDTSVTEALVVEDAHA